MTVWWYREAFNGVIPQVCSAQSTFQCVCVCVWRSNSTHTHFYIHLVSSLVSYVLLTNFVFLCFCPCLFSSPSLPLSTSLSPSASQDPAGIFELVELVGNGTYGQVYKVRLPELLCCHVCVCVCEASYYEKCTKTSYIFFIFCAVPSPLFHHEKFKESETCHWNYFKVKTIKFSVISQG